MTQHSAEIEDFLVAVEAAEGQARLDHESGACRDSEWSCSWCEVEGR